MPFGHLVVGPPGSGKSTYCEAMRRFLDADGRHMVVVNLDPANDAPPYEPTVDMAELVTVDEAARAHGLGPNGAMLLCMDVLLANVDWLVDRLRAAVAARADGRRPFFLLDCPGQVELFTHADGVRRLVQALGEAMDLRLVCVNVVDSHHCLEVDNFIAAAVASLATMLQLELPHVNVLSKIDALGAAGPLPLPLACFADCDDLSLVVDAAGRAPTFSAAHERLTRALCDVLDDYGLVSFMPLCVTDVEALAQVSVAADKACGYAFNAAEGDNAGLIATVAGPTVWEYDRVAAMEDKYLKGGWEAADDDGPEVREEGWAAGGDDAEGRGPDDEVARAARVYHEALGATAG